MNRIAFSQGHELEPYGATAFALIPGWLGSEMMLANFGVTETDWRDALAQDRAGGLPTAPPGFAHSETPRYVGRAAVALATRTAGRCTSGVRTEVIRRGHYGAPHCPRT